MLAGVELSEAPFCILVVNQRHSAVCLIGFAGLRRPYPNGFTILRTPASTMCLLSTAKEEATFSTNQARGKTSIWRTTTGSVARTQGKKTLWR